MFLEPGRTAYDLNFRLFGIDIRVHPMFWLISALLGYSIIDYMGIQNGWPYLAIWMGCMFVSVLVHEFGHIAMGLLFGNRGHIVLYGMGGLAINSNVTSTWWKRVLVSLAGPLAGFALLGAILVVLLAVAPGYAWIYSQSMLSVFGIRVPMAGIEIDFVMNPYLNSALRNLFFLNFFLGLLNLLPILPLDGGQISRDILSYLNPHNGVRLALGISAVIAGVLAAHCFLYGSQQMPNGLIPFLRYGSRFTGIFFALMALQSFTQLQQQPHQDPYDPWMGERRPWER